MTTRKVLRAECRRLSDQLAATNHESRKVRAARLRDLLKENDSLREQVKALQAKLNAPSPSA